MPKAYSYIRFSSTKQLKGDSVARQIKLSESYAQKNNLELDTELALSDLGLSAYDRSNVTKGALGEFLKFVQENKIPKGSYLLVESLDRLSRDKVLDALGIFTNILSAGIIIVTLADEQIYSYEKVNDNSSNLIMSILIMSRANEESVIKSMRLRSSWDAKRKNIEKRRLTSRCPYWLKPTDGDQGFEFIPDRVEVVKRIFQMSKDGIGNATIVKMLNSENIPCFSDRTDGWQNSYIQKILSNQAVYGELQLKMHRDGQIISLHAISNYYPAIMSREDWLLAAMSRQSRRTRGGVSKGKHLSNLLSGLLKCGYCGSSMNMGGYVNKKANGEKRQGKYVACSNARRGMGCKFIQWNYQDLEAFVLGYCKTVDFAKALQLNNETATVLENAIKTTFSLAENIKKHEKIREKLLSAIEAGDESMDVSFLVKEISERTIKINELAQLKQLAEAEVVQLKNQASMRPAIQRNMEDVINKLKTLNGDELHKFRIRLSELIKQSVSQIKLFPWGLWDPEKESRLINSLKKCGYKLEEIDQHIKEINSIPKIRFRHMEMLFRNGEIRVVSVETNVLMDYNPSTEKWINGSGFLKKAIMARS